MKPNTATLNRTPLRTEVSALTYRAETRLYQGTITITNEGSKAVEGPLEVIFRSLSGGVALHNATGCNRRHPFLRVPLDSGVLLPGGSVSVAVSFAKSRWSLRGIRYELRVAAAGFQQETLPLSPTAADDAPPAGAGASSRITPHYAAATTSL